MAKSLAAYLGERVRSFNNRAHEQFDKLQSAATRPPLSWIEPPGGADPDLGNPAHIRRLEYVYGRIVQTLQRLQCDDIPGFSIQRAEAESLRGQYEKVQEQLWTGGATPGKARTSKAAPHPFTLAQVIRRLRDNAELEPLRLTYLDTELFTACYALFRYDRDLLPAERASLYERIWREVQFYAEKAKGYHDLSTIWWGIATVVGCAVRVTFRQRLDAVRKILDLSYSGNGEPPSAGQLLSGEGRHLQSFEHSGDLLSPFRSAVFCHQNAVHIRRWVESLRDPRLMPLIRKLREWADSCAEACCAPDVEHSPHTLYDAALHLAFLAEWWKDRVSSWCRAVAIIQEGLPADYNKSDIQGIATTSAPFAHRAKQVVDTVKRFRESSTEKHPLVIALFGPPGAGKSALARAACAEKSSICEINLSVFATPAELFTAIDDWLDHNKTQTKPILFLDEFDVRLEGEFWYRWLLSLLWDCKYPLVKSGVTRLADFPTGPLTVFLAASRYESFHDFRDFALSSKAKDHKAADMLTRIDESVDIPRLTGTERALVMQAAAKSKVAGEASNELLALVYMAELEDNARGIVKLLKGVNAGKEFGPDDLLPGARARLYQGAGLPQWVSV